MKDNITSICAAFLNIIDKKHDKELLNQILYFHSQAFSMKAISDTLRYYGMITMVVSINEDQLHQIPLPAIAHCKKGSKEVFRCVTKIEKSNVYYYEDKKGEKQSVDDFVKEWTGTTLLAEKTEATFIKREKSIPSRWIKGIIIILILLAFLGTLFNQLSDISSYVIQTILLLVGSMAGLLTILKSHGMENGITAYLCDGKKWEKLDCNAVLRSDSRIMGISYGVVATAYFLCGLLAHVFLHDHVVFSQVSIVGVPVVGYLLYKQYFVLKKVCSLCLIIAFIYLTYNMLSWFHIDMWSIQLNRYVYQLGLIGLMAFIVSLLLDQYLLTYSEKQKSVNELFRWKTNKEIFDIQLSNSPEVSFPDDLSPIIIHPKSSEQVVTLLISLNCGHCLRALYDLKLLVTVSPETRFEILIHVCNKEENEDISRLMAHSGEGAIDNIIEYYTYRLEIESPDPNVSSDYLQSYLKWNKAHQNNLFPQIYYNHALVPSQYRMRDLLYFMS